VIGLTIDGRRLTAAPGTFLLAAARGAGIEIPTLCDHPDLEPVGACRLCLVEVTHPDWKGWSNLVTACLYPVAEGLEVATGSAKVRDARRRVLALLAARCPGSAAILDLAAKYGARDDALSPVAGPAHGRADTGVRPYVDESVCITCGLCTRLCETFVTSAIATVGRGAAKGVAPFANEPAAECVGCGGCAIVCPTGAIEARRTDSAYEIWGRSFPADVVPVDEARCIGCGSCEEACPFSVARVVLRACGRAVAAIPAEHCRGCGACVGACPSGALAQEVRERSGTVPGVTVIACPRAGLTGAVLPETTRLIEVPCTGRVSVPLLLGELARGQDGVLVLGRHPSTCRFEGGEARAAEHVRDAAAAAALAGLPGRIRFEQAAPGPDGPRHTLLRFRTALCALGPSPVARIPGTAGHDDLDRALELVAALGTRVDPDTTAWLADRGLPPAVAGGPVLAAPSLAALAAVGSRLFRPVDFEGLFAQTLAVLSRLGTTDVGVSTSEVAGESSIARLRRAPSVLVLSPLERYALGGAGVAVTLVDDLLRTSGYELPRPPRPARIATDGSAVETGLVLALGHVPVDVGNDILPASFQLGPDARRAALARLARAEAEGAVALLCSDPLALARWALLTRHGTWRTSRVRPALGVQIAWLSLVEAPLSIASLSGTLDPGLALEETAP
jgi:formate hydrogenlyase subunit 6/NADH:ubiquinone oxidoreductase subunit I/coenzyme F420-reducing hydrogenase delta subunit